MKSQQWYAAELHVRQSHGVQALKLGRPPESTNQHLARTHVTLPIGLQNLNQRFALAAGCQVARHQEQSCDRPAAGCVRSPPGD